MYVYASDFQNDRSRMCGEAESALILVQSSMGFVWHRIIRDPDASLLVRGHRPMRSDVRIVESSGN